MHKVQFAFILILAYVTQSFCFAKSGYDVSDEEFLKNYNNTVSFNLSVKTIEVRLI